MKKNLLLLITVLLSTFTQSQNNKIAVQNGTETRYYKTLDSVVKYLRDNDKIYLTEGSHKKTKPNTDDIDILKINKENVTFYGVGYDARHTGVQSTSHILGTIEIYNKNIGFIGLGLPHLDVNSEHSSVLIKRCSLTRITFKEISSGLITHSKINSSIVLYDDVNLSLYNSILGSVNGLSSIYPKRINLNVKNCLIKSSYLSYVNTEGSSIKSSNNIFLISPISYTSFGQRGSFTNNIFQTSVSWSSNTAQSNNKVGVNPKFVDTKDYVLENDSPAKNAGTDGTDCGIYGGSFPFTYNSTIPKILKLNIAGATDDNGKLKVIFDVEAQKQ